MKVKPRPYQTEGIFLIKSALAGHLNENIQYRLGHQGKATKVLYVLSTGGGKTFVYAVISEGAASKGSRVLILEHRKELIFQASMALANLGVMHQVVAPPDKIAEIKRRHVVKFGQPFIRPNAAVAVASVPNLGDMETLPERILAGEVEAPDVLCGGTPCQAFSIAGLRKSLDDARGNLSLIFCEIADAIDTIRAQRGQMETAKRNIPRNSKRDGIAMGAIMKDELHETAMREFREHGRDKRLTWKDVGVVYAIVIFVCWIVSTIRG